MFNMEISIYLIFNIFFKYKIRSYLKARWYPETPLDGEFHGTISKVVSSDLRFYIEQILIFKYSKNYNNPTEGTKRIR